MKERFKNFFAEEPGASSARFEDGEDRKERHRSFGMAAALFLAAVLVGALVLAFREYRKLIIQTQEEQLMTIARTVSNNISVYVDFYFTDLQETVNSMEYRGVSEESAQTGDWKNLQAFLREHMGFQSEDVENLVYIREKEDGYDLLAWGGENSGYEAVNSLSGRLPGTRIDILEGADRQFYLGLSVPGAEEGCRLAYVIHIERMYQKVGSYIRVGENGYVMIKDSTGRILLHPVKEQIGEDVIEYRKSQYPEFDFRELEELVAHQLEGREDVETYHSYWWADEVPGRVMKIGAYTPLWFPDDFLIICAVMDYDEIAGPVNRGLATVSVLSLALMYLFAAAFFRMRRSALEKRRIEQENRYLRCVNSKLEELRQKEERMAHDQRLRTIGSLTSGIAHEFRNILTPVMGYAGMIELMAQEQGQEEIRENAQEIYASAERASELISQIASLSRKGTDRIRKAMEIRGLAEGIRKAAEAICPSGIRVETSFQWPEGCRIWCGETEFHQVLLNLCSNAFDAMKEQGGVLRLEGHREPALPGSSAAYVTMSVRDDGCGMSRETLEMIFEPFFTTKAAGEGTGLGLSMVQGILESMGGRIEAESEPGKGSCFTIYLPEYESNEEKES